MTMQRDCVSITLMPEAGMQLNLEVCTQDAFSAGYVKDNPEFWAQLVRDVQMGLMAERQRVLREGFVGAVVEDNGLHAKYRACGA